MRFYHRFFEVVEVEKVVEWAREVVQRGLDEDRTCTGSERVPNENYGGDHEGDVRNGPRLGLGTRRVSTEQNGLRGALQ